MNKKKLSEFVSFVNGISSSDRVAILHDTDADGISAAVIACRAIERFCGVKPVLVFTQLKRMVSIEPQTITLLKKKKITKLVALDLAVDQKAERVKKIEKFAGVLILDHHKKYAELSSKKTAFIKAVDLQKNIEPSKYTTSKMSFDLFSKVADLSDSAWIAIVGLVGDFSVQAWESFVDKTFKESGLNLNQIKDCTELVNSVETVHIEDVSELFEFYLNVDGPNDLLNSKFASYKQIVNCEIERLSKEFDNKAEYFPDQQLLFFVFKSKYAIKSPLINYLSSRSSRNRTLVLVEDVGNGVLSLSARRQDFKVKMNDLLEKAVKPLKGGIAGGHVPAAGGKIRRGDLEKFKQNLIKILSK